LLSDDGSLSKDIFDDEQMNDQAENLTKTEKMNAAEQKKLRVLQKKTSADSSSVLGAEPQTLNNDFELKNVKLKQTMPSKKQNTKSDPQADQIWTKPKKSLAGTPDKPYDDDDDEEEIDNMLLQMRLKPTKI